MNYQEAFNITLSLIGFIGGFVLRALWQANIDLQQADKELIDRVGRIEVLVAGNYITRQELDSHLNKLSAKMDHLIEIIDRKMDKQSWNNGNV